MARRWTPQRFVTMRRIRVIICVVSLILSSAVTFGLSARKTVALTVNGQTKTVSTYAYSIPRLLQEQGIDVKTHDLVESTSGQHLRNHAVVNVRSAYQTTITIEGQEVPFWTVASSVDQLLGFFKENEKEAAKVTVDITNVYNKLTGGLVINKNGPVTVIADGQSSQAPDGRLPAASILDSKGIVLNKEDRVSVEQEGSETILRVQRVTHGEETRTVTIPYGTQTIIDSTLQSGETEVRQEGQNGEKQQVYSVTYVDGVAESETLESETTTKIPLDEIIAVGPEKVADPKDTSNGQADSGTNSTQDSNTNSSDSKQDSTSDDSSSQGSDTANNNSPSAGNTGNSSSGDPSPSPSSDSGSNGSSNNSGSSGTTTPTGLWHPSPSAAQTYAAGAAAQYGWTGQNWSDLVSLWNRESSWLWYAKNSSSGAYGIPQSLPGDKMATFGANWRDDASIQIAWGLSYIAGRYGSPSAAWAHSESVGWY